MRKVRVVIGTLIMMSIGLTSCSLPHDERYRDINKVLNDIDYQNIGTIVHEEIDNGDGILAPSYKKIHYKEDIMSDVMHKLQNTPSNVNEDCSDIKFDKEKDKSISCNYYGTNITIGNSHLDDYGGKFRIQIVDGQNGR